MFNQYRHFAIAIGVGLWLMLFPALSSANDIPAQSKALAHYIMAVMNDLNGDNRQALMEYEKSVSFNTLQPLPHLRLGSYYARMGRLEEATKQLKTVLKLEPTASHARYLLALVYSSQKKYDLAAFEYESILKTASKNNPNNLEIHVYLAQLYYALHKYPQAIEQLSQIIQTQPDNISALYLLGSIYLNLEDRDKAKDYFRKILSLDPKHDGALNSLAYMYAEDNNNLEEALTMAKQAVELDPSNGAYYDTLGWVLFKRGMNTEGLMALEKAKSFIEDPIIYEHIGDVYEAVNEPALARKSWLKSLELDPKQPKVSQRLESLNRSASSQDVNYNSTR